MKKILLSVIALFVAISMNAAYQVPADGGYFNLANSSNWGGHWFDLGEGGNLNFDASEYDYAWIKYSGNTGKFRFGLTYSEWKSTEAWGETYYDAMVTPEDAEGIAYIKIEKEKTYEFDINKADNPYKGDTWDKHLRQIWTQDDGPEVSVTVEGIWFGTAAELEALLGGGSSEGGSEGGEEGGEAPAAAGNAKVIAINAENAIGLNEDNGDPLDKGYELYAGDEGTLTIGDAGTFKPQSIKADINGDTSINGGLQEANNNPKDADGGTPATTLNAPASGAFFVFDAKADGYLYAIIKASSNKAYTVFEEGTAIGYKFAAVGDAESELGATYQFELKGEGEINEIKNPVEWAEREYLKVANPDAYAAHLTVDEAGAETWTPINKSGLGVIAFPVFADLQYIFNANGSKMMLGGIVFSEADDVVIKTIDGVEIYKGGGATAIQGAKVVTVAGNSAIYNLAGQKVNASYKGIVIKDGKKYIQK